MGKIEYNNYVEVGILLKEIECDATQIEIGDVHFQIANIEQFPFFRFEEPLKIRNKAIIEYYVKIMKAFISICNLIIQEDKDIHVIEEFIVNFTNTLENQHFSTELIPMAKEVNDLYYKAKNELLRNNLDDISEKLITLRNLIFKNWTFIEQKEGRDI